MARLTPAGSQLRPLALALAFTGLATLALVAISPRLSRPSRRSPASEALPAEVSQKSPTQSFTSRDEFAVFEGRVWTQPAGAHSAWALVNGTGMPADPAAKSIAQISSDGDTLVAVTPEGRVYDADLAPSPTGLKATWHNGWGWPLRLAAKPLFLPKNELGFAISILDLQNGTYYNDPAGNPHLILGIETLYVLAEGGQTVLFDDPWLPPNAFRFHFSTPEHGRFKAVGLSASGSTVVVIDQAGRIFHRIIDFDTLGGNPGIHYSFVADHDAGEKPEGFWASIRTHLPFLFDTRKLPGDDWHEQPRVLDADGQPARITGRITLLQTGKGNDAREIRVEAESGSSATAQTGYYSKPIASPGPWVFHATGDALSRASLEVTRPIDRGAPAGESLTGQADLYDYRFLHAPTSSIAATIAGFDTGFDPATVTLEFSETERLEMTLALTAGIFPVGNDAFIDGALLVPKNLPGRASRDFVEDWLEDKGAMPVRVHITPGLLEIEINRLRASSKNSAVIHFRRGPHAAAAARL